MTTKFDGEWMPFFGDWLFESERVNELAGDTFHLYVWLLWRQWKHESLPSDPSEIAPGRFAKRWKQLWGRKDERGKVSQFFDVGEDGRLRNETLAMLRDDAAERRGKKSTSGRNGAAVTNAKRWGCRSSDRLSDPPSVAPPIADATENGSLPSRTGPDRTGQHATRAACARGDAVPETSDPEPSAYAPPPHPDVRSRCLAMHPTLDTPAVRAALDRWEGHLRERGKAPYTSRNWESNLAKWERWGPDRLVHAIDATLCTTACTVFESEHGERPGAAASSAPNEADQRKREEEARADRKRVDDERERMKQRIERDGFDSLTKAEQGWSRYQGIAPPLAKAQAG